MVCMFVLPTCICEACKSIVIIWSAPDTDNMLATSLAEIGARLCNENRFRPSHGELQALLISKNNPQLSVAIEILPVKYYNIWNSGSEISF